MAITLQQLREIAEQNYLDPSEAEQLLSETNDILCQIERLHKIDTTGVQPLIHPLNTHQPLRVDAVTHDGHSSKLADIAPLFSNGHYLVPIIIRDK